MKGYEILELSNVAGFFYAEGNHPKVDVLDETPNSGGWFCFEPDSFVDAAMELQRIGFTATQILEAKRR